MFDIILLPADCLLLWSLNRRTQEGKFLCDFSSQKVWIFIWQIINILGVIGLVVALGESNIDQISSARMS